MLRTQPTPTVSGAGGAGAAGAAAAGAGAVLAPPAGALAAPFACGFAAVAGGAALGLGAHPVRIAAHRAPPITARLSIPRISFSPDACPDPAAPTASRPLVDRQAAVALYAFSPFHVWHGQEVRMYGLLDLGAVAALAAAAAYVAKPRPALLIPVAAAVAFAFGLQYMGALVFASIAGVAVVARLAKRISTRELALLVGAGVAGLAVWLPWIVARLPEQMKTPWGFTARR